MCNRNHDHFVRLNCVDQAEREPPKQSATEAMRDSDPKIGPLPHDVESMLDVVKRAPRPSLADS
jgi:hypothetical protein